MSNEYYNQTGNPTYGSPGASATVRAEFAAISAAFAMLPTLAGNANKAVVVNGSGDAMTVTAGTLALAGNLTTAGAFTTSGAHDLTLSLGATVTLTLPGADATLATLALAETLTNKTLTAPIINAGTISGTIAGNVTLSGTLTGPTISGGALVDSPITGTTTNDNAAAGVVGEYISSVVATGSAVALTTDTPANVTHVSLTAGDWDVEGYVYFKPAATTNMTILQAAINTTSATIPADVGEAPISEVSAALSQGFPASLPVARARVSLASTTSVYLVAQAKFNSSTCAAAGFVSARRVR